MTGFVSDHGTDLCVLCKADTGIPTDTHVTERSNYFDGAGQLCGLCGSDE